MAQKYSIQLLTATTANWNASQYIVPEGELIAELQTDGKIQLKIGDGLHKFSDLPYVADKGPKGDAGISPTVSTSKENGAATITIIDGSGAHSFQVNDGKSPTVSTAKLDGVATVIVTDADGEHTFTVNDGVSPTVSTLKTGGVATVTITDESGEHIFTIKDGDKGEPFTFADLTDAQKLELKGDTGEGFVIKGTYDTLELLQENVPLPNVGDVYAIGTAAPYDIYIYHGIFVLGSYACFDMKMIKDVGLIMANPILYMILAVLISLFLIYISIWIGCLIKKSELLEKVIYGKLI